MLTPDEWAKDVFAKMCEQESSTRTEVGSPRYSAMNEEMNALWQKTKAVFLEYTQSFCKHRDILHYDADAWSITIKRTDEEKVQPLTVSYSDTFHHIETRCGFDVRKYSVRMTPKGIELVSNSNDMRTSPEEIAATTLEDLLTSQ